MWNAKNEFGCAVLSALFEPKLRCRAKSKVWSMLLPSFLSFATIGFFHYSRFSENIQYKEVR